MQNMSGYKAMHFKGYTVTCDRKGCTVQTTRRVVASDGIAALCDNCFQDYKKEQWKLKRYNAKG